MRKRPDETLSKWRRRALPGYRSSPVVGCHMCVLGAPIKIARRGLQGALGPIMQGLEYCLISLVVCGTTGADLCR